MPTYTDDTIEGGTFTNSFANKVVSVQVDSGHTIWDCIYPVVESVLESSGVFTDSITDYHATLCVEHGVFTDSFLASAVTSTNMVEHGRLTDTILSRIEDSLVESGLFTEDFSISLISFTVENGELSDAYNTGSSLNNTVVEHGVFTNSHKLGLATLLSNAGVFTDSYTHTTTIVTLVVESGQFTDIAVSSNISIDKLVEHGILTDAIAQTLIANNFVVEHGVFDDTTSGGGVGAGDAYHAHLETFAMTRYNNFGFQSMAVVDGVLMGVTPDGVYRLDAGTDAGENIDTYVEHDWEDKILNDKSGDMSPDWHVKRPRYAYINGQVDGQISVVIGYVDVDGNEVISDPYVFPVQNNGGITNIRTELGRGIRSRLLSPRLQNIDGADHSLNDGKLIVDKTDRSI